MKPAVARKPVVRERTIVGVFARYFVPAYRAGGPIRTLDAFIEQTPQRFLPLVLASNRDLGVESPLNVQPDVWTMRGNAEVYYAAADSWAKYWRALLALRRRRPDVLYLNSLFDVKYSLLPLMLGRIGWFGPVKILLAPRGEFGVGALSIKARRKTFVLRATSLLRLHRGITWHASSALEKSDIMKAQPTARCILVKEDEALLSRKEPPDSRSVPGAPVRAVFVGRLAPIKGLDILLKAFGQLKHPIVLDVIGAEEDSAYAQTCRDIAKTLPATVKVSFEGPRAHEELVAVLPQYDVMFLPTHGENFGHVIAEALAASVPVFCSAYTPWSDVLREGGGRVVQPNTVEAWTAAVTTLSTSEDDELVQMRRSAADAFTRWAARRETRSVLEMLLDGEAGDTRLAS